MKLVEFENIKDDLTKGKEVVVRFFTYNKNHWVDIMGEIQNVHGTSKTWFNDNGLTLKFVSVIKEHGEYDDKKRPKLKTHTINSVKYVTINSNNIIFIKYCSFRGEKIKKLKSKLSKDVI